MRRTKTSHGTDIEISTNKFNNGSSTEGIIVNGQRLSQRITNFIENKNGSPRFTDKYTSPEQERSGSYLRPMGPVEVAYPSSQPSRSFTPTHQFSSPPASENNAFSRSIAVEDPYTNAPINFTMMDPKSPTHSRFNQQSRDSFDSPSNGQEYPMQTMSVGISNQDDFRFDPLLEESSFDYLGTPTRTRGQTPTNGRI